MFIYVLICVVNPSQLIKKVSRSVCKRWRKGGQKTVNNEQQAMRRGNVHDYCGWSQGNVMNAHRSFYPGVVINQPKKKIITISTR
jgi:hypothetical protein